MELISRDTENPSVLGKSGMLSPPGPIHLPRALLPLLSSPLQHVVRSVRQVRAEDPMAASDMAELLVITTDPLLKGITEDQRVKVQCMCVSYSYSCTLERLLTTLRLLHTSYCQYYLEHIQCYRCR